MIVRHGIYISLTCISFFLLHISLLRKCQRIFYNFYFRVQQLVNYICKHVLVVTLDFVWQEIFAGSNFGDFSSDPQK